MVGKTNLTKFQIRVHLSNEVRGTRNVSHRRWMNILPITWLNSLSFEFQLTRGLRYLENGWKYSRFRIITSLAVGYLKYLFVKNLEKGGPLNIFVFDVYSNKWKDLESNVAIFPLPTELCSTNYWMIIIKLDFASRDNVLFYLFVANIEGDPNFRVM